MIVLLIDFVKRIHFFNKYGHANKSYKFFIQINTKTFSNNGTATKEFILIKIFFTKLNFPEYVVIKNF